MAKERQVAVTCVGHHLHSQGSRVSEIGRTSKIRDDNTWKHIPCLTGWCLTGPLPGQLSSSMP